VGKTGILGLGYGCGHERFYTMVTAQARQYGITLEGLFDKRIAEFTVNAYRQLFPFIPNAWRHLDGLWKNYVNNANPKQFAEWGGCRFESGKITLPNKMTLRYQIGDQSIWGGKLLENITQALARIVIMQAALRLAERGYRFCLQAHDELVFAVPDDDVNSAKMIIL
jgi:DNA polymerase